MGVVVGFDRYLLKWSILCGTACGSVERLRESTWMAALTREEITRSLPIYCCLGADYFVDRPYADAVGVFDQVVNDDAGQSWTAVNERSVELNQGRPGFHAFDNVRRALDSPHANDRQFTMRPLINLPHQTQSQRPNWTPAEPTRVVTDITASRL